MSVMNNIDLHYVPIHYLQHYMPMLKKTLPRVMAKSHNLVTFQHFTDALANGHYTLWVGYVGGELAGWFTVEILGEPGRGWLSMPFAWADQRITKKAPIIEAVLQMLKNIAKTTGFKGVRFFSARKGMKRLAEKSGMKPRFVEYYTEV